MDANDFVSSEKRKYKFHIGSQVASSLSGFIAGAIVASIIWYSVYYVTSLY